MADYIYFVQLEIPQELEEDFNRIYDAEHVPNLLTVPGVRSCTRYRLESADVDGVARYAAIYEIDSPDLPDTAVWREQSDKGEWITRIRPHLTSRSHATYRRIA